MPCPSCKTNGKVFYNPSINAIQETINVQKPKCTLQTATAECETDFKTSWHVLIGKTEKQTEVTADLTNMQKKMRQRRTSNKQVKEVGVDKHQRQYLTSQKQVR